MASRLWRFLTTDVSELFSGEVVTNKADAAGAVFELAEVLQTQGPKVQDLAPLVGQLDTLLDALNSPLAEIVEKSVPFVPIATGLLKFYLEQSKQPLTLEKCVAIVSQSAYLESFKKFLADDAVLEQIGKTSASDALKVKTKQLGDLEISEEEARRTVTKFPVCKLAKHFGDVLKARLQQAGLEETAAQILIERVSWQTPRYMDQVWAASTEAVKHLGQPTFDAWRQEQAKYQSIADYLAEKIEPGPQKSVFNEDNLTFCDIYVPLEVKLLDEKGQPLQDTPPRDLENWVTESLFQTDSLEILFIQGEAGRGKSVFCRMFADWVREILFPAYVPILIPLRSLKVLETTLTETLANALENYDFVSSDTGWLTDDNTRFLFLLDGFDELLLEGRDSGGLKEFLPQVVQFQRNCHHRFLITGRPLSLQGIERVITQAKDDLQRAELQPMSDPLREIWYQQWADKFGQDETEGLKQFLEACPKDVQYGLAREPLLLYLLGRMHRKGRLKAEMFEGTDGTEAKVVIYDEVVRWVIEEQRQNENVRQVGLEPEDLRQALTEAAVCVIQSGNEVAKISFLEARLQQDSNNPVYELLQRARQEVEVSEDKLLNNLLTAFYIKPASGDKEGSVEFAHKSFGEFLFAERLKNALEDWSQKGSGRRSQYSVPTESMHWEIYDLLGYGGLTVEVVDDLRVLLTQHSTFDPVLLFQRLHYFYLRWWEGEFISAVSDNWPQKKMLALRERVPDREEQLGLRQVDVVAGLNVIILLLELHRFGQGQVGLQSGLTFYPCGNPAEEHYFFPYRLYRIIGLSECLERDAFRNIVGPHLEGAFLQQVYLGQTYLYGCNLNGAKLNSATLANSWLSFAKLKGADLTEANLATANLRDANLRDANLRDANLRDANLRDANLSGADLTGAYLSAVILRKAILKSANLTGADLTGSILYRANLINANLQAAVLKSTYLCDADLEKADFKDIKYNSRTQWLNASALHTATNVSSQLMEDKDFSLAVLLSQGMQNAQDGELLKAISDYQEVQRLTQDCQISSLAWSLLCISGSIYGYIDRQEVFLAGERAVNLDSKSAIPRFCRGILKTLKNDKEGAISDFQSCMKGYDYSDIPNKWKTRIKSWLRNLEMEEKGITSEELMQLKQELMA